MAVRLYVSYLTKDARAKTKQKYFQSLGLKSKIGAVRLLDCYTIDAKLNARQLEKAKTLLANPLLQNASSSTSNLEPRTFSFAFHIAFLPGVTDNLGHTAKETLADGARVKFKPGQNVYSSQVLFISGPISGSDAKKIANSLCNPLIQHAAIISFAEFKNGGLPAFLPKVKLKGSGKVSLVDLDVTDEELVKLGKLGIADATGRRGPLALSLEELKTIRDYFKTQGRKPTDIELEALAQTWSEHCKHTIFADPIDNIKDGLFRHYIKRATDEILKRDDKKGFCVSVFTDNAGGINFDGKQILAYKVETHNTPSALDPFGGSITGIGGVNRDALGFGLGAKPVANFYGFCLADPEDKSKLYRDKNLQQPMLSSRRIMDGVIAGINAGGNQSGIPTPLGFLHFNNRFRGKPLVFAGTLGLMPKKVGSRKAWQKAANAGDLIVMVGGRVGADGIHGATFSSEGLDPNSPATAVQIGDPITQKKFSDALSKEARDMELFNSITDCGAGGLSSAVGEMAKDCGGCDVELDKIPLKYPGLAPWQIWISESQERMVLAVPPRKWQKFEKLMSTRGVEATVIGKFSNDGNCRVKFGNKTILEIEMEFLHNGRPKTHLLTKPVAKTRQSLGAPKILNPKSYILNLLSRLNLASTEFLSTQYDHEVQGGSVLKPLQGSGRVNSEAAVIRPDLTSNKAAVLSYGLHPELSELDPYAMAANAIDSAARAAVAAGADIDHLALLDNFCWCSPEDPKRLWQLKEAARACYDIAIAYGTPFISGKDSMHNDFKGFSADGKPSKISIPPTLLITALGVIPNVTKVISLDAKLPGDALYILGETRDEAEQKVPQVNSKKNLVIYQSFYQAAQNNLIASAISVGSGGLSIALTKMLMAGGLGAEISLAMLPGDWQENYQALFSESAGRILVSVDPKKAGEFEKLMMGNAIGKIGKITKGTKLLIKDKLDKKIVSLQVGQAQKSYKSRFANY